MIHSQLVVVSRMNVSLSPKISLVWLKHLYVLALECFTRACSSRINISFRVHENFSRSLRSRSIEDDANALLLRTPYTTPPPGSTKRLLFRRRHPVGEAIGLVTCRAAPLDKLRKAVVVQMQSAIVNAFYKLWQL